MNQMFNPNQLSQAQPAQPFQYAQPRNPDRFKTDVRFVALKWSIGMVDREVQFRLKYSDPRASRSQVLQEIFSAWAQDQIARAEEFLAGQEPPFQIDFPILTLTKPADQCEREDARTCLEKPTVDVIDRVVKHRCMYLDPKTSRNTVMNEVVNAWAFLQWHRATMTLRDNTSNPLSSDTLEAANA